MSFLDKMAQAGGKLLKKCVDNNGMFLFVTAAASWFLASASQTVALIFNKKIDKEQKNFMIPQEILDGTFNIASYVAITLPIMGLAKKGALKNFPDNRQAVEGAKTIAAIAGGVISSNIVTPILRNKFGVAFKDKFAPKENEINPNPIQTPAAPANPQLRQPLTMNAYLNFTKNLPSGGSLRI